ncbi:MAG: hypothetical protein DMF69_23950 [Acidobacteria bacterium]|nr:MAG: hypothetical protein DMF69_23950 [Acidobacteriota bacterium]
MGNGKIQPHVFDPEDIAMRRLLVLILTLGILLSSLVPAFGQDPATQQPSAEELEKQKAELKKNAYRLLDQVIDESQSLRLPENRVRIQINAGDLLWANNQERARSLFSMASDGVIEMIRSSSAAAPTTVGPQRGPQNQDRRWVALRQELVLAAARHDAPLAYQLLAATKNPNPVQTQPADPRNPRVQAFAEDSLEQTLLGRVAALDPKLAAQNAEEMMQKGQFPRTVADVITQLQQQDAEAANKLADKTVKRIQSANILTNNEAGNLAQTLIAPGPRLATATATTAATTTTSTATTAAPQRGRAPVLDQSVYTDLLSTVIDAALKATPQTQTQTNQQRGQGFQGGGRAIAAVRGPNSPQQATPPTEQQVEQNSARRLLSSLQSTLPNIDLYLPARATAVRQKLAELGITDNARNNLAQTMNALQQPNANAETLFQAASAAPPQLQSRLYQQAASKALEEGNTDRARQIATDHLQATARDTMMQRISFRELTKKADGVRLEEIRQNLGRLTSESDKVSLLIQIADDLKKDNPKAQRQVLEEARQVINHRATSYDQFEDQLRVARAFSTVDEARSFEILEPGISQLNELLSAAAVLSGLFREGEMTVNQGGSRLTTTIGRYGQELAVLAKSDFEHSEMLAGRFQLVEPRIMARLAIIQSALGVNNFSEPTGNFIRNIGGFGTDFIVRP